ncbi:MAG: hypothetical protein OXE99_01025 [Cellvibrionales bacterium]|nr:hypothetical protein [Cellvibrionales bacterium]
MNQSIIYSWRKVTLRAKFIVIGLLSVAVLLPGVFTGFMGDDFLHYLLIQYPGLLPLVDDASLFNLFSFVDTSDAKRQALMAKSLLPWWTGKDFSWNFWRPLSEISLFFDYCFYPRQPWLMHLHSLLLFIVLLAISAWLYQLIFSKPYESQNIHRCISHPGDNDFTGPRKRMEASPVTARTYGNNSLALWAFALFSLSVSHAITVTWIANRHAIIASIFILLSVIYYHKFFHTDNVFYRWSYYLSSVGMTVLALCSSELGLCVGVWLLIYSLVQTNKPLVTKLFYLLPYFIVFLAWVWIYERGGFGVRGYSTFYVDPVVAPLAFAKMFFLNAPIIILSQVFIVPSDVLNLPRYPWLMPLLGWLVLASIMYFLRSNKHQKTGFALLILSLLLMVPISTSPAQDRNLLQVSLAFSGVLALLIVQGLDYLKQNKRPWIKSMVYLLIILHLGLSPLLTLPMSYLPAWLTGAAKYRASTLQVNENESIFVFKGDMMEMVYLYPQLIVKQKFGPKKLWNLGGSGAKLSVKLIDDYTLSVTALSPFFSSGDLMARNVMLEPFNGESIDLDGVTIRIQSFDNQGYPKRMEIQFAQPIETITFYLWEQSRFKPLSFSQKKDYEF